MEAFMAIGWVSKGVWFLFSNLICTKARNAVVINAKILCRVIAGSGVGSELELLWWRFNGRSDVTPLVFGHKGGLWLENEYILL